MNRNFTNKSIPNFLLYLVFFLLVFVNILLFTFKNDLLFDGHFDSNTWIFVKVIFVIIYSYFIFTICHRFYFSDSYLNFDNEKVEISRLNFTNKTIKTSLKYEDITKIELYYQTIGRTTTSYFDVCANSEIIRIPQEIYQNTWRIKEIVATFQEIKEVKILNYEIKINIFFYIHEIVSKIAITVLLVFLIILLKMQLFG